MFGLRRILGARIDSQKNINNALVKKQPILKKPVEEKKFEFKIGGRNSYGGRECMISEEMATQIDQYLTSVEQRQRLDSNFLKEAKIDGRMRGILLDWIFQIQSKFDLSAETFYLTCFMLDRVITPMNVTKEFLQLIGLACLYVASKFEEVNLPHVDDFVYLGGDSCTTEQLFEAERQILKALKFQLTFAYPNHFLRKFCLLTNVFTDLLKLSELLMDFCLFNYSTAHWTSSEIAAVSIHRAHKILERHCSVVLLEIFKTTAEQVLTKSATLKVNLLREFDQVEKPKGLRMKYEKTEALKLVDEYILSCK